MSNVTTDVGEMIAAYLEACGVTVAYGVISIHNMPILDAFGRRNRVRFVPACGEAGAMNMADAHARVSGGIGVCVTSTGTAAGNAAGGMVEALTAGSPVVHLTGQIDLPFLDRGCGFIHEAPDQPALLKAVSKAYFRIWSAETALGTIKEAVRTALTAPMGPVSVEIPIDVQQSAVTYDPDELTAASIPAAAASNGEIDRLAAALRAARRPMIWAGGGARGAEAEVRALAALGVAVVTSVNGRGVLAEDHPLSLGSFGASPALEPLYAAGDFLLLLGSRLRSNETRNYALNLPRPVWRIDCNGAQAGRGIRPDGFLCGDIAATLRGLLDRLDGRLAIDPGYAADVAAARAAAEARLRSDAGPYAELIDALRAELPAGAQWVRDITLSNSIWGNRLPQLGHARAGVHALGGGIGQGVPMAIGAALGGGGRRTVCLTGDGGLAMCMAELATAARLRADIVFVVMNDRGYGVIRNIQDARYGARHYFTDVSPPDLGGLAGLYGISHRRLTTAADFAPGLRWALAQGGPVMLEVDMTAIGPFGISFAGPPTGKAA